MQKYSVTPRLDSSRKPVTVGEITKGDRALIGQLGELGPRTDVFLSLDFEHVVGIFGKRGSGKSHLLGSLLEAIAWKQTQHGFAEVSVPRGAILFDVLNIFQWMGLRGELPLEVRLFHVPNYPPPSALSTELTLRPQDLNADEWCVLFGIDGIREPMGQILYEAISNAKRLGIRSIDGLIKTVQSLSSRFAAETIRALTQRFASYNALGLFSENGYLLSDLCRERSATIILFAGVPEDIRGLYVFLIIRRLFEDRVRSSQIEKGRQLSPQSADADQAIPRMWVFIDEAQNIIPTRHASYALDMLVRYVREGRNYGLSLCFTTQQPASVDSRIMAQIDTLVAFLLTVPSDLENVRSHLKGPEPREIALVGKKLSFVEALRSLSIGQCVVSNTETSRAVIVNARPRLTPHGGSEG